MRKSGKGTAVRLTSVLVIAIALVMAAFAHRMPATADPLAVPDFAVAPLPDGTIPVICTTGSNTGNGHKHLHEACEFCRIAGSFDLPAPGETGQSIAFQYIRADVPAHAQAVTIASFFPAAPLRGPPSVS